VQFFATAGGFALILDAVLPLGRNPISWVFPASPWFGLANSPTDFTCTTSLGCNSAAMLVGWLQGHHWVEAQAACSFAIGVSFALTVARRGDFRIDSSSRSSFA